MNNVPGRKAAFFSTSPTTWRICGFRARTLSNSCRPRASIASRISPSTRPNNLSAAITTDTSSVTEFSFTSTKSNCSSSAAPLFTIGFSTTRRRMVITYRCPEMKGRLPATCPSSADYTDIRSRAPLLRRFSTSSTEVRYRTLNSSTWGKSPYAAARSALCVMECRAHQDWKSGDLMRNARRSVPPLLRPARTLGCGK